MDIGLYGKYNTGTEKLSGIVRDCFDNWMLFDNNASDISSALDNGTLTCIKNSVCRSAVRKFNCK